ncbi:MAG: hypothetical protein FD126_866 [Elusimicrobia bacterium]|nr:MAG: hypothetical protein FD126_866 [Elusimicrobiota bacterium]
MIRLLLPLVFALPATAQTPRIGAAGAVSGNVSAGAGSSRRALKSGSEVFHKDSVTTDAKGRLQVMLLDQTVFTVGPDSNIVLDEFIYDPFTDTGKVTAQVTKGVFRFVTGKVAGKKPADMKIKIPAGTIGIRGTFGAGSVGANGDTLVGLLGPGSDNNGDERVGGLDIDTGSDSQSLDEPGTGVTVKSDGDVSEPFTLTPEQTAALNAGDSGEGSGGGSGGASSSSGGTGGGDDGDESASASAGQDTARAAESSAETGDLGDASSDLGEDSNTAAQAAAGAAGILDGIATWNDVRTVQSGQAHYYLSGAAGSWNLTTCNSGSCANNSEGSMSFQMNIDFGARTYGGLGSFISGSDSDTTVGSVSASTTIDVASFAALDGSARITDVEGVCSAVIDLINVGGSAAHQASATLNYNTGSTVGSGTVVAPRFDGLIPQ